MSQTILDQILDQLPTLESSELQQLSQAVQHYLAHKETAAKRVIFHQALVTSGLVKHIKHARYQKQQHLIQIQGEPVSITILEERR